jgi:hypothetical protein
MPRVLCRKRYGVRSTSALFTGSRTFGFFAFGHVKNGLQGIIFRSHDELPAGLVAALGEIPIESLQRIFEHWMERFEEISQDNSDY